MSSDPPSRGSLKIPDDLDVASRRKDEEAAAITGVEDRLKAGEIDGAQADAELLEIVLRRFHYLDAEQLAELRAFGQELNEEPEMVCTRPEPEDFTEAPSP